MRRPRPDKIIIGITGSFASGKSTVAGFFRAKNVEIINADRIAHALLLPGTKSYRRIIAVFGKDILNNRGYIRRLKLGQIVFSRKAALERLNRLLHPYVIRQIKARIKKTARRLIILDAPLIVEAGIRGLVHKLIVVKASRSRQVLRAVKKFSLTPQQALARMKFQAPLRLKKRFADYIIDNNGTFKQTEKQVVEIRRQLWKS